MHFIIHTLRIIIFAILISNIVTKPDNSLLRFDKHVEVETKEKIYNITTSRNNNITMGESDEHDFVNNNIEFIIGWVLIIIIFCVCTIIIVIVNLCPWLCPDRISEFNRRCVRRSCLCFSDCYRRFFRIFRIFHNFRHIIIPEPVPQAEVIYHEVVYDERNISIQEDHI